VLHVLDHPRINTPWIGSSGGAAEIFNSSGDGTARQKITGFGQTSYGGENPTAKCFREPGDKVAESMKRQSNSVFDRAIVHSKNSSGK